MTVVCGQKSSLGKTLYDNFSSFIRKDLVRLQTIGLMFNIVLFLCFLCCFEAKLQKTVTKPIEDLTQKIQKP